MAELKSILRPAATLTELYDHLDSAILQARAIHQAQCGALAIAALADVSNGHIEMAVAALLDDAGRAAEELHQRARLALIHWREAEAG